MRESRPITGILRSRSAGQAHPLKPKQHLQRQTFALGGATAALALALCCGEARAFTDPLIDMVSQDGGAGLGLAVRVEQSPYRGVGARFDFVPLYLFESEKFYVHSYRVGRKFDPRPGLRYDFFLAHRFEGFPIDRVPPSLSGMASRGPGFDAGIGVEQTLPWGTLYGEALHDISAVSRGSELRAGYHYHWQIGGLQLRPNVMVAARDHKLNDYYYGVRPGEATAERPVYMPGAGLIGQLGVTARYDINERWKMVAGLSFTRWGSGVRRSPITDVPLGQASGFVGLAYDFSPTQSDWKEHAPLIGKAMYGRSTDCNLLPVMRLGCTSIDTEDKTRIAAFELGRPLLREVNGWPVDFIGYIGLLRHSERGLQPDSWEFNAYIKGFFYGFPWRERVRTRVGFGLGVSYAQRVPFVEERDQQRRGRGTSKILNYLDPSIDVNLGDVFGSRALRETYFGFGASHRSGIFGNSQLLGNVNGGSNYLYTYLEWQM
jgi:outer membrane protein